jgi:xanthosine utilization system XapX-like protein
LTTTKFNVVGGISLLQDIQMVLSLGATFTNGNTFVLFNNDSTDPVTTTGLLTVSGKALTEGEFFGTGGQQFQITYAGGDGNDIVMTAVPEPGSLALLGGMGILIGLRRRRRVVDYRLSSN